MVEGTLPVLSRIFRQSPSLSRSKTGLNSVFFLQLGWFGYVISICRLFNAKFSLNIYFRYMICKHILLITFFNEPELIFCTQLNGFMYCDITVAI